MKKYLLGGVLFFLILVFLIPTIFAIDPIDCIDSDGGINYYVKGKTSGINDATLGGFVEVNDYCLGQTLNEFYCINLIDADTFYDIAVAKIEYECSLGCSGGECERCVPKCEYSSVCSISVSDGCGGMCTRSTYGQSCGSDKICKRGSCVLEKKGGSSSKDEENIIKLISGEENIIKLISGEENIPNNQTIKLGQKRNNLSKNSFFFLFEAGLFLLTITFLVSYSLLKTRKNN